MEEEYLVERLQPQVKALEHRARVARYIRLGLEGAELGLVFLLPMLTLQGVFPAFLAFLAALVGVAVVARHMGGWQVAQQRAEAAAAALEREKHWFRTGSGPHAKRDAGLLVERCEALIAGERDLWSSRVDSVLRRSRGPDAA